MAKSLKVPRTLQNSIRGKRPIEDFEDREENINSEEVAVNMNLVKFPQKFSNQKLLIINSL